MFALRGLVSIFLFNMICLFSGGHFFIKLELSSPVALRRSQSLRLALSKRANHYSPHDREDLRCRSGTARDRRAAFSWETFLSFQLRGAARRFHSKASATKLFRTTRQRLIHRRQPR